MSDLLKDQEQLTDALQTVQRLYMKLNNKKECVSFYTKHIQPIYAEFEANGENKEQDKALNKHIVSFSEAEVCPLCNNTGEYSFGGSFGGSVQTQRCPCGRT